MLFAAIDDFTRQRCIGIMTAMSDGGVASSLKDIASAAVLTRGLLRMHSLSAVYAVLSALGQSSSALKSMGINVSELRSIGFDALVLRHAGYDFAALALAGFSPVELSRAGFSTEVKVSDAQASTRVVLLLFATPALSPLVCFTCRMLLLQESKAAMTFLKLQKTAITH
jgi:hypothetical protein